MCINGQYNIMRINNIMCIIFMTDTMALNLVISPQIEGGHIYLTVFRSPSNYYLIATVVCLSLWTAYAYQVIMCQHFIFTKLAVKMYSTYFNILS